MPGFVTKHTSEEFMLTRIVNTVLGFSLLIAGCSTTRNEFEVAPELLTASGTAKVSKLNNQNLAVAVEVKNLAKPEKTQPGAAVYVLWMQPMDAVGAPPQNLGAFNVDKNYYAELDATTTHSKFDLFVTAEPSGQSIGPSGKRLMWTRVER